MDALFGTKLSCDIGQRIHQCQRDRRVANLVGSFELQIHDRVCWQPIAEPADLEAAAPAFLGCRVGCDLDIVTEVCQRCANLVGDSNDHVSYWTAGNAVDSRRISFENARFLGCDQLRRIAQNVLVVQPDAGDCGGLTLEHIRAVEPSTQPGFQNPNIALPPVKVFNRHRRGQFKERRATDGSGRHRLDDRSHGIDQSDHFLGSRDLAIDSESFFQVHQVRRRVKTNTVSGLVKQCSDHSGGAAFSFCARQVNDLNAGRFAGLDDGVWFRRFIRDGIRFTGWGALGEFIGIDREMLTMP